MRMFATILAAAIIATPSAQVPQSDTVDAIDFLLAFRDGKADQYKGKTISGSGADFVGSTPNLVLVVGAAGEGGASATVTTWDQFRAAQDARTTLIVSLDAAAFKRSSWPRMGQKPDEYSFRGVFQGRTRTVGRMGSESQAPDTGPCGGAAPPNVIGVGNAPRTTHCIPVLDNAIIEKR